MAGAVCSASPWSCFRAESSQTSQGNEAEIKEPISRWRGAMMGSETGPRGRGRRLLSHGEESVLPWPGWVPRLLRALGVGVGWESGCGWGNPAAGQGISDTFWGTGLSAQGGDPQGMPGSQPTPGHSGPCVCTKPSTLAGRWQLGGCGAGPGNEADVSRHPASRRGCSGSSPQAPRVTSVLRPQQLRPRPLGSAPLKSPRPFPSSGGGVSERGSVTPGVPPPQPGGYFGFGEKRKAAPGGRLLRWRAGNAPQHAGDCGGWGKRNINTAPHPLVPPGGQGKRIHLI